MRKAEFLKALLSNKQCYAYVKYNDDDGSYIQIVKKDLIKVVKESDKNTVFDATISDSSFIYLKKIVIMSEIHNTILEQLGGNKFVAMTGSHSFVTREAHEKNPHPWLEMCITTNKSKANRLKITYMPDDTYEMEFSSQWFDTKTFELKKNTKALFTNCHAEDLQETFTEVTGLLTHL